MQIRLFGRYIIELSNLYQYTYEFNAYLYSEEDS